MDMEHMSKVTSYIKETSKKIFSMDREFNITIHITSMENFKRGKKRKAN